jgi:ribosome-associated heat shock protein Hsp15
VTALRLDKFLWFARLAKTRDVAQGLAEAGRVRIDGRVVDRAAAPVRVGNVIGLPLHGRVRIVRVERLPERRVSPPDVPAIYTDLSPAPREERPI